ncbi:hypothetical protein NSQ62_14455 [Solibacillus sp. FSL H8-0523]|uniref:hypothetical protein n=1 Tax=Solibacillus sp. FSL H8-0523 TaxID=2954511 RepID=UPI0031013E75
MKYEVELKCSRSVYVENATGVTIVDGIYGITDAKNNLLFSAPKEEVKYIVKIDDAIKS